MPHPIESTRIYFLYGMPKTRPCCLLINKNKCVFIVYRLLLLLSNIPTCLRSAHSAHTQTIQYFVLSLAPAYNKLCLNAQTRSHKRHTVTPKYIYIFATVSKQIKIINHYKNETIFCVLQIAYSEQFNLCVRPEGLVHIIKLLN